jgi:hypothetical protein
MTRRRASASPPWTVDALMGWLRARLGLPLPTLPLPSGWSATLTRLWEMFIVGGPPDPDSPRPWQFQIEGTWQIFPSCPATLDQLSICVWDVGGPTCLPPAGAPAGRRRAAPRTRAGTRAPARKGPPRPKQEPPSKRKPPSPKRSGRALLDAWSALFRRRGRTHKTHA